MTSEDFKMLKEVLEHHMREIRERIRYASSLEDLVKYIRKYLELAELYHSVEEAEKRLLKK